MPISISADSKTIVADVQVMTSNLWVMPADDSSRARQITYGVVMASGASPGRPMGGSSSQYSPARGTFFGKLLFWIVDADGKNRKRLTYDDRMNSDPVVTQDGRYIVFSSYREGIWSIWRMNLDGSDQKQLAAVSDPMTNPYYSSKKPV